MTARDTRGTSTARAVAIAAGIALAAAPASAQPEPSSRAQAAAHSRQAQVYFQRGDYDRAIAEYQAAFDLSAEPSLIFNIALCYDRTDRPEPALEAFQRYLALAPSGSVADEARNDVARLVPIVEHRATDRAAAEAHRRDEAARRQEAIQRETAAREASAARRTRLSRYVMLAGGVVAVAGATSHVLAWRTRDRLLHEPDPDSYFTDRHRFEIERGVTIGAYAAGALTLAAGLVLGLTGPGRDDGPRLSAAITARGAAMVVEWSR